jgi:hypothetical protein
MVQEGTVQQEIIKKNQETVFFRKKETENSLAASANQKRRGKDLIVSLQSVLSVSLLHQFVLARYLVSVTSLIFWSGTSS